jgi:hypothetical protein
VAGGEVLVIDLHSNEVMAVRRIFARNQVEPRVFWDTAMTCPRVFEKPNDRDFIPVVLMPPQRNVIGDRHE